MTRPLVFGITYTQFKEFLDARIKKDEESKKNLIEAIAKAPKSEVIDSILGQLEAWLTQAVVDFGEAIGCHNMPALAEKLFDDWQKDFAKEIAALN